MVLEGKWDAVAKRGMQWKQEQSQDFSMIAKILLGLRKFRNHSENFAIIAKISQS